MYEDMKRKTKAPDNRQIIQGVKRLSPELKLWWNIVRN